MIKKPDWIYKPVDVPNLEQIQKEFKQIINSHYAEKFAPDAFKDFSTVYVSLDNKIVRENAPFYFEFLKDLGLDDRWDYCMMAGGRSSDKTRSTVHLDEHDDWHSRCFSLNIPIENCHDSYTVWYEVKDGSGSAKTGQSALFNGTWGYLESDLIRELDRIPVTQPAFINISKPHRPETLHSELRLNLASRFKPEIFDYFDLD